MLRPAIGERIQTMMDMHRLQAVTRNQAHKLRQPDQQHMGVHAATVADDQWAR